ncbi:MAG TPA: GrpB family protein [Bacilli bacterium]|nr:GrpB family protein [Bacilli bacterium]
MALQRGIVELEDYNSNWKEDYEREEKILKEVLKDRIIEIHHIGSTSIVGLKAKPVIDILIVINSLEEITEIENLLKDYDYSNRGQQGVNDRYFFAKGPEDARSHYIHFTEPKSNTYFNQVYFKRYLIEHPDYIKKYCDLKQELAEKYADERPKYTQGKNEFITNVINLAKEEYND